MARKKWKEHWILDDKGRPIQADLFTWARWFGSRERVVAQETIGQNMVSTIFLGIDHSFTDEGPPILWETMTFGAKLNQHQLRCAGSREQAEAMHEEMVRLVCEATGVPYDANRQRANDKGIWRRQAAVHGRNMREAAKALGWNPDERARRDRLDG
jgi:hypothetical protein